MKINALVAEEFTDALLVRMAFKTRLKVVTGKPSYNCSLTRKFMEVTLGGLCSHYNKK